MIYVVLVVLWFAIGIVVAVVMGRRGHHFGAWMGLAVFGPFAVPLAAQAVRYEPGVEVHGGPLPEGVPGIRLLIGVDGSPESHAAALQSVRLLGPRLGRVALAQVVDYDTGRESPDSVDRAAARETLDRIAAELQSVATIVCDPIVLVGRPADALFQYAREQGCDLISIGSRGRGASRRVLGSVAERFASRAEIPVLLSAVDPPSSEGDGTADPDS